MDSLRTPNLPQFDSNLYKLLKNSVRRSLDYSVKHKLRDLMSQGLLITKENIPNDVVPSSLDEVAPSTVLHNLSTSQLTLFIISLPETNFIGFTDVGNLLRSNNISSYFVNGIVTQSAYNVLMTFVDNQGNKSNAYVYYNPQTTIIFIPIDRHYLL